MDAGGGSKKKLIRGSKKLFPGDQKKYYEVQKKLFTRIEMLSCGKGANIASRTGSKKIIRPGSLPKNDMKIAHSLAGAHSLVKMYETHYARTTVGSLGGRRSASPQTRCWRPWWWSLFWTCPCCCCCCCCSWLLWIFWMVLVLVLVVLVPWEEATFKKIKKLEGGWGGGRSASPPDASLTSNLTIAFVAGKEVFLLLL